MQRLRSMSVDATTAPRIVLVAGIILSPSFFDLGSVKPFDVSKGAILWVFGWLAFGLTAIEMLRGQLRGKWFRLGTIASIYIVSAALATAFSVTRLASMFGWYARY